MNPTYIATIFQDAIDEWRWHIKHGNGNFVACSGEGYANRADCTNELHNVIKAIKEGDYRIDEPENGKEPMLI